MTLVEQIAKLEREMQALLAWCKDPSNKPGTEAWKTKTQLYKEKKAHRDELEKDLKISLL